jgi:IS30 family transposase
LAPQPSPLRALEHGNGTISRAGRGLSDGHQRGLSHGHGQHRAPVRPHITGASNRSAIGTLAERKARYVLLFHLPDNHTAEATSAGVAEAMSPLPAGLRGTLTWDQGSEMAGHVQPAADLGTSITFCEAHSPWQRPTNENTNGLLRDYFPKGTDLPVHSAERLGEVQDELNNRPRKCLNWETPATVFARLQSDHS